MISNSKKEHPLLLRLIAQAKAENSMNRQELAEAIGMSPIEFSRLVNGLRPIPDPRDVDNIEIYTRIGERLKMAPDEVIKELLPYENLSPFWTGFYKQRDKKKAPSCISSTTDEKVSILRMNLAGVEEYIDVILAGLKVYITKVKGWRWFESEYDVKEYLKQRKGE
jgi:hypothetical protein